MEERLFILKVCVKAVRWWVWVAIQGALSPRLLYKTGVRFEKLEHGFIMTYDTERPIL